VAKTLNQGCQIFLGTTYQKGKIVPYTIQNVHKIGLMAIKYINLFHGKTPKKFPQIGIFGLKMCHLATLL
jgi:hypothetical protein